MMLLDYIENFLRKTYLLALLDAKLDMTLDFSIKIASSCDIILYSQRMRGSEVVNVYLPRFPSQRYMPCLRH